MKDAGKIIEKVAPKLDEVQSEYPKNGPFALVRYERPVGFTGRNGHGIAVALEVWRHEGVVELSPITSKGRVANCAIQVPDDPDALRELASRLVAIADAVASK